MYGIFYSERNTLLIMIMMTELCQIFGRIYFANKAETFDLYYKVCLESIKYMFHRTRSERATKPLHKHAYAVYRDFSRLKNDNFPSDPK